MKKVFIGVCCIFLVLALLKLDSKIGWSWWWVTSPLWMLAAFIVLLAIVVVILYYTFRNKA